MFLNENNFSIEVPFNDRYTYADDCMVHRCNAHIWCGGNTTYADALKMGVSEFAAISNDEKYIDEAKVHIEALERFAGHQPSFHLNEIPIRYWDIFGLES